jgi:hypothetical protein
VKLIMSNRSAMAHPEPMMILVPTFVKGSTEWKKAAIEARCSFPGDPSDKLKFIKNSAVRRQVTWTLFHFACAQCVIEGCDVPVRVPFHLRDLENLHTLIVGALSQHKNLQIIIEGVCHAEESHLTLLSVLVMQNPKRFMIGSPELNRPHIYKRIGHLVNYLLGIRISGNMVSVFYSGCELPLQIGSSSSALRKTLKSLIEARPTIIMVVESPPRGSIESQALVSAFTPIGGNGYDNLELVGDASMSGAVALPACCRCAM